MLFKRTLFKRTTLGLLGMLLIAGSMTTGAAETAPDYNKQIAPVFRKYCNGCHNADDAEGKLSLEKFTHLMKGGENGTVITPGNIEQSRLVLLLEGKAEPVMPPADNEAPTKQEIELIKAWIRAGATGPTGEPFRLVTPKIPLQSAVKLPVRSAAYSPDEKVIAVARHGIVELRAAASDRVLKTLTGHTGHINAICFSPNGEVLYVCSGEVGLFGQVTAWQTRDWKRLRSWRGHRDSIYSVAISPDGTQLATGSYDQKIILWNSQTGESLQELTGHNGSVYGLAFHPDGKFLASASADRTVKLWDVVMGKRITTFIEPTKAQLSVAFSPDGRRVVSGGKDNRIRVWDVRKLGKAKQFPILYSRFAHEAPILKLAFAPNGKQLITTAENLSLKVWETKEYTQLKVLPNQSDWPTSLIVSPNSTTVWVGRADGTEGRYSIAEMKTDIVRARPVYDAALPLPVHRANDGQQQPQVSEVEPNQTLESAMPLALPVKVSGVLSPVTDQASDTDLFRISAKRGETWILETRAARMKSPADTKIEVLDVNGRPVLRYLLQAVRDSYITFRPIDSDQNVVRVKNWEEMGLNQYLYMNGEICKIFRMPQGPDSGFLFYENAGKRRSYFDTSGQCHAIEDAIYIVEPYKPGTKLVDNGLPVFPLYYANDDESDRKFGADSKLTFTAPQEGSYFVRVRDVRGFSGSDFNYELTIRKPEPDFSVTAKVAQSKIPLGSGQRITLTAHRFDNFAGPIDVKISGLPAGFHVSSPVTIEAGHHIAQAVVYTDRNLTAAKSDHARSTTDLNQPVRAAKPAEIWSQLKTSATAEMYGSQVAKNVKSIGRFHIGSKPRFIVHFSPEESAAPKLTTNKSPETNAIPEIVIEPGTTITARLWLERFGFDGEQKFDIENLPHGVIVDNIGLSGVLVRNKEKERQIFLTAADWVPESSRLVFAVSKGLGNQASRPVRLIVRRKDQSVARRVKN